MSRTLILMRHAKSSWDNPGLDDHDRPLNERGKRSARALGDWLRREWLAPGEVLCSKAHRTRETLTGLELANPRVVLSDALYLAGAAEMLAVLHGAVGETVLMLGHNPGTALLAHRLVRVAPDHPRFGDYPTGATLVVTFEGDRWGAVAPGTGDVRGFVVPRELM